MGRPLNKKYFGNRNIGRPSTADDKIGGEGIASITWQSQGAFIGNSNVQVLTALPAMPAPTIPGGVQATYTALFEVESVTTGAGKDLLALGDTFTLASVPGLIAKVVDISGPNAFFSVTAAGASRGNALALADIPKDTLTVTMTQSGGTGTAGEFTVDIYFQIKASSVVITEKGSGYTGAESLVFTKPGTTVGNVPVASLVVTTDSGLVGSATNQENAIIIRAKVDSEASVLAGDIIRQVNARSYKVKTLNGIAVCKLVADDTPNANQAYITATDYNGNTYFVTKLTAHRARLTRNTNNESTWLFNDGESARWTFDSTDELSVQIENA